MEALIDRQDQAQLLTEWLRILSEPRRLAILNLLMQGVQCNCELGDKLNMAPNLISHHLGVLREAGLVQAERDPSDARWIYYSINREVLDEINALLSSFFDPARIQCRSLSCRPAFASCRAKPTTVVES